ncbi:Pleckstrin homology domain-containing protein [Crepidotus variabilis]|uniref:Pleckstrin homology domain-containing protein n=1 Tax=Crepidotus variabilis TaxID=179855 RepID=A0A9P6JS02_9AGAR|nr:Pleckstrin homology domain-containing protein [Crepidotus variabilis]
MKSVTSSSSSWILRSYHNSNTQDNFLNPPSSPTYIDPREAPKPPSSPSSAAPSALRAGISAVFRRPQRQRAPSLRSAYSASTTTSSSETQSLVHPYSPAPMGPLPVVSNHSRPDDGDECPVCLEPLSFSFRLPGEKPHIVPECGHALHEARFSFFFALRRIACFIAVYGPPPTQGAKGIPRKSNLGVCGVCRRPMKVGDGDGGKSNKLAALTGMGDSRTAPLYPGRDTPTSRAARQPPKPYDPNDDDPLEQTGSLRDRQQDHAQYIVAPSIQVRPEFSSLTRTTDLNQPLTCIVIIELPGKRAAGSVPGPVIPENYGKPRSQHSGSGHSSPVPEPTPRHRKDFSEREPSYHSHNHSQNRQTFDSQYSAPSNGHDSTNYGPNTLIHSEEDSPFIAITEDLRNRIIDWKGHPLSDLGPLQMYDLLSVRRDSAIREFYVYLFKEAIICVVEEKKRGLGRLLSETGSMASNGQSKGVLRLKGRIYVRHIKHVTASSAAGEMSLTIDMEDELASFILIFKERSSLESWKNNIQALVNMFQSQNGTAPVRTQEPERPLDIEEFGGSQKAMRMLSGSTQTTVSTVDSLLNGSSRSTMSSSTSHGSFTNGRHPHQNKPNLATLGEDDELSNYDNSPVNMVTPHTSSGPSNSLAPLPHPPVDLILVISLPPPTSLPSTAQLKVRVIKATLDFLVASMGVKDRLSLVTFEVGVGGRVRKTPFLMAGRPQSRQRLEKFIDEIGSRFDEVKDEFLIRGSKDEKTDVVTAVNHGLDVVLQRKARNPVSGMLLISDASDSTRRAQMDLVLARAEAANVPIHSFGYGRSHDPASLWLMSNHTSGTYTFVKDWYDLRDCVAGCVGGMMSIGLLNMKLHLKIVDSYRFRIRKVSGGPQSILSADGQNVDVDVGELRYGEKKEMLIELELDNTDQQKALQRAQQNRSLNATDQYVQSLGLDALAIDDSADLVDGMMDRMIDEVPVIEVDGSFFDPAAAKNVSRLAHPVLLTITLLPPSPNSTKPQSAVSDPVIVRRRMELLASDMITRALVLVSRRNFPQAQKIMGETKRILHTVLQSISRTLSNQNGGRNRKEMLTLVAVRAMQAILADLQILSEALEDNVELFAHDQRNFGAQQAMILRDQKSWSGRSATERLFWTTDNSIELVSRSTDWVTRD